jgi:YggT family protein
MESIVITLLNFLQIYIVILTIRVLATWFIQDWSGQPWATLAQLTDPYLNIFRQVIPPIGGLDLSPIVAFLLLSFLQQGLQAVAG